jgi:hypothetical protein
LREHPAEVRELAFYLISCPGHDMYGLYYKPVASMVAETGRCEPSIRNGLATLETLGYSVYDGVGEWVWVVEMAQIQMALPLLPRDYKVNAANKWYQKLPKNRHLGSYFDRYCDSLLLAPPRREFSPTEIVSPCEHRETEGTVDSLFGAPMPLISKSTEDLVLVPSTDVPVPEKRAVGTERFDLFWMVYPKKVGKKAARIEWDKLKPDDNLTATIVSAVDRHRRSYRWLRDGGQAIPDPERYLKYERWNDEQLDGTAPRLSKQTLHNVEKPGSFLTGFR